MRRISGGNLGKKANDLCVCMPKFCGERLIRVSSAVASRTSRVRIRDCRDWFSFHNSTLWSSSAASRSSMLLGLRNIQQMLTAIKVNDLHFARRISVFCGLAHCNPRCDVLRRWECRELEMERKGSREVEGLEEEKGRYKRKGKGLANNDAKLLSTSSKVNCSNILFILEQLANAEKKKVGSGSR